MRLLRTTGTVLSAAVAALAASGCSFITGVRDTSRVTVTVSPDIIGLNQTAQAIGTAYDGDRPLSGNSRYIVTYTSRDPNVATVDQARGLVTGKAYGTTYIVGENRGKRDSAQITVRPIQAVQVIIGGSRTPTYRVGAPNGITATAYDSARRAISDRPVAYTSRNTAVLTVSDIGAVQPLAVGTAWIVASIDNGPGTTPQTDSVLATVTPTPVASVRITPSNDNNFTPTLYVGQTLQFSATVTDSLTQVVTRPVTWSIPSQYNSYFTIDSSSGLARGTAPLSGTAPVTARTTVVPGVPNPQTIGGQVTIQVLSPADSVRVLQQGADVTTITVLNGSTATITLSAIDVQRNALPGRQFTVTNSNPAVVGLSNTVVGSTVQISGLSAGSATLTFVTRNNNDGSAQGKTSTITVTVQ